MFSDEFLSSLPSDPVMGVLKAIEITRTCWADSGRPDWTDDDLEVAQEATALFLELAAADLLGFPPPRYEFTGTPGEVCANTSAYMEDLRVHLQGHAQQVRGEQNRNRFRAALGKSFTYEFSQGDLDRVQILINDLRGLISQTSALEKDHQRRLLSRLERLQAEMHKRVSDLDRFWGLVGDAGVAIGKLGKDAKPIVDRIREITEIVWQTQSRAEELPSGTSLPQLEHKPEDDNATKKE